MVIKTNSSKYIFIQIIFFFFFLPSGRFLFDSNYERFRSSCTREIQQLRYLILYSGGRYRVISGRPTFASEKLFERSEICIVTSKDAVIMIFAHKSVIEGSPMRTMKVEWYTGSRVDCTNKCLSNRTRNVRKTVPRLRGYFPKWPSSKHEYLVSRENQFSAEKLFNCLSRLMHKTIITTIKRIGEVEYKRKIISYYLLKRQ